MSISIYDDSHFSQRFQETRWATKAEIQRVTRRIDLTEATYPSAGIPLLNDGRNAWIDDQDNHSLIFGSTGSKKTRLFVLPMLNIMARAGESFVVSDPKGELYERTAETCKEQGYNVVCLNFRDFMRSDSWNPLTLAYERYQAGDVNGASSILNDLIDGISAPSRAKTNDLFWAQMSEALMFGCGMVLLETGTKNEVNMASLVNLIMDYGKFNRCTLTDIAELMDPLSAAGQNLQAPLGTPEKTWQSIFASVFAIIKIFTLQEDLTRMLSGDSFEMQSIGKKKTAVYLVIPDEKETFHFLVSIFVKQCYESLIIAAASCKNGSLPVRVNFVLDEFANIPAISAMGSMITAARSRNIRFHLVIQSMHQLTKHYGEDAEVIKGNCANWVFLNSKELVLLREISEMCGSITDAVGENRRLISVSQLQRLNKEKGECLIFCQRQYPFIAEMADIDDCAWDRPKAPSWPENSVDYEVLSPQRILLQMKSKRYGDRINKLVSTDPWSDIFS